jgi:hypothetical protein
MTEFTPAIVLGGTACVAGQPPRLIAGHPRQTPAIGVGA